MGSTSSIEREKQMQALSDLVEGLRASQSSLDVIIGSLNQTIKDKRRVPELDRRDIEDTMQRLELVRKSIRHEGQGVLRYCL